MNPQKMPRIRFKTGMRGIFYLLVLTDKSIGLDERLLKTGNIHFSHRTVILQRQRGGRPAASPKVQTMAMMRIEACASWVAEIHRPATSRFSAFFGIRQR